MAVEIIMLSEMEKDKYHVISLILGINVTKQTKQKKMHRYREQAGDCQRGQGSRDV